MNTETLRQYDAQFRLVINPLNWKFGVEKYSRWGLSIDFGPVGVMFFRPAFYRGKSILPLEEDFMNWPEYGEEDLDI